MPTGFDIASSLGKVVNLLRVSTPGWEPQIVLKVRFADIDRSASTQFAVNLLAGMRPEGHGWLQTSQFGGQPTVTGLAQIRERHLLKSA